MIVFLFSRASSRALPPRIAAHLGVAKTIVGVTL
jgi:hypothetical protein